MDEYEKSKQRTKRYQKVLATMEETFGYTSFKPYQYQVINQLIKGERICGIFPTGYGKSICYQLVAPYTNKLVVVISPLISLMEDQCAGLEKTSIRACCYNSTVKKKTKVLHKIIHGHFDIVYVTPESCISSTFLEAIQEAENLGLIAIDEAHCISSYGFDFRPSYRELSVMTNTFPDVAVLAVTATATQDVCADICNTLEIPEENILKSSFDRPNLYLASIGKEKMENDIIDVLKLHPDVPTIIYCITRKKTEAIADMLKSKGYACSHYHGGVENDVKSEAHHGFLEGKYQIIVATIAFGMGINKPDVRLVIHYGCPSNIEGYYQEIGRAGRDGKDSYCYVFHGQGDFRQQEMLISGSEGTSSGHGYLKRRKEMLRKIQEYVYNNSICRRKILLPYFRDYPEDDCKNCDNCNGQVVLSHHLDRADQTVTQQANLLMQSMLGLEQRYGATMYVNILRGSKAKTITPEMKKLPGYGQGRNNSAAWWKELIKRLLERMYLQSDQVGGGFNSHVLSPSKKGRKWLDKYQLSIAGVGKTREITVEMETSQ